MSGYSPTEYELRKQLMEEIKKMSNEQYKEIFRILKRNNVSYTENSNGIFFDLNAVSDITIQELQKFVELSQAQQIAEKERTKELDTLRNEAHADSDNDSAAS
jgi:hypothetical protein